jgi:Eco57I restriction-modification methylase
VNKLNLADDIRFTGPALPETFVHLELEKELKPFLLKKKELTEAWREWKYTLREPLSQAATWVRVRNVLVRPMAKLAGYAVAEESEPLVHTREGNEPGGLLLKAGNDTLRTWVLDFAADLDAPIQRGKAYRYTPARIASRVLKATGEDLGLIINGEEVRLLLDPARSDSSVTFLLNGWRQMRMKDDAPDSFALMLALLHPECRTKLPDILDKARLTQGQVTKDLRVQARQAVSGFVNHVLRHPDNAECFADVFGDEPDREQLDKLGKQLWRESLILIYRLLFSLKGETSGAFGFASLSLWRHTYSPSAALGRVATQVIEDHVPTGRFLEDGIRNLFRIFEQGIACPELKIDPLGGQLFGKDATPLLSSATWGEEACAILLDKLLRAPRGKGKARRLVRLSYRDLGVEELGRVYEALLELEPQIAHDDLVRLRRAKLEVVVPAAQAKKYRPAHLRPASDDNGETNPDDSDEETTGKKTKVEWVEQIKKGRFILKTGLGRKASGAYYTPDTFVRFLVRETLGPQVEKVSPPDDPQPSEILRLKVCDPAMGSGHFLVGACRFLAERLYEAARGCAERGRKAELEAEKTRDENKREQLEAEAAMWWQRVIDLPDHHDEILRYLPGRVVEGDAERGLSPEKARMVCRRLVAVHCLYGVDKNPLAVELAKLSLWLESQAEGMPLTFMDHRLVVGDSLTGPFWTNLLHRPSNNDKLADDLFTKNLHGKFTKVLSEAIREVHLLQKDVGATVEENDEKRSKLQRLHRLLAPFKVIAAAWSGGVMLGPKHCDDEAYIKLLRHVADEGDLPELMWKDDGEPTRIAQMIAKGLGVRCVPSEREALYHLVVNTGPNGHEPAIPALSFDLAFPEVFYPNGQPQNRQGFHSTLGNPPWERIRREDVEYFAVYDVSYLEQNNKQERKKTQDQILSTPEVAEHYKMYVEEFLQQDRICDRVYESHKAKVKGQLAGRGSYDAYMIFSERSLGLLRRDGRIGIVLPSAFHANEGATGTRRIFLEQNRLTHCFSYENRRKLFEIDSRFKFANVIAEKRTLAEARQDRDGFECAFYLHDDRWLESDHRNPEPLVYTLDFVKRTGGDYLSFLELREKEDLEAAERMYADSISFGEVCEQLGLQISQELNMTYDSDRFTPTSNVLDSSEDPRDPVISKQLLEQGYLLLHEGKTFHQFDDCWGNRPRYLVHASNLADKSSWTSAASFFRFAFRDIARATDERTGIFCLLPPGSLFGNTSPCERIPNNRSSSAVILFNALLDSYIFDWCLRLRGSGVHVNLFILNGCPVPSSLFTKDWHKKVMSRFLAHNALRLTCNHEGYRPLWEEQVGKEWREPGRNKFDWPVLEGDDARWAVRAAIDAVVAQAYGLNREQYAHVLSTFSHKSYPKAPDLCLAAFDELTKIGLDAFCKKHDPYHDIPLNTALPKPVIDLPIPDAPEQPKKGGKRKGKKAKGNGTQGELL